MIYFLRNMQIITHKTLIHLIMYYEKYLSYLKIKAKENNIALYTYM